MKAVVISKFGGPEVLEVQERAIPTYEDHEVLIRVHAAGINRPDVFQRMGKYNAPEGTVQDIPGLEISGTVVEIGHNVTEVSVGDEVFSLLSGGGYAEYAVVSASLCIPKPTSISFEEACILPETIYTVWHNVFQRGGLTASDHFLVHGGAGGIGSTAIQLANLFGAKVFTTVSSEEKQEYCMELGAEVAINYKENDFELELNAAEITLILDALGGEYFAKNINLLEPDGRLIYINASMGNKVELNIMKLMQKRILISGSTLRARSLDFKSALTQEIIAHVLPLVESKKFVPQLYKTFLINEVGEAHRMMEEGNVYGKLAVKILC
ncbi:NAD(P)H-quinone oxidoreductase [Sphingobacterium hungaricum]